MPLSWVEIYSKTKITIIRLTEVCKWISSGVIHPSPPHWIIFQTVILQLLSAASHLLLSELARSQRATRQHHSTYLPLVLAHFRHVQTSFWSMFFFLFEVLSLNVESHSRWLLQFLLLSHKKFESGNWSSVK